MRLENKRREQAAQLLAEDRYTDAKIAEICGISERALAKWKKRGEFATRVQELTDKYGERALKLGLARRERRLTVLSDMHERLLTIVEERGNDKDLAEVPGGKTGLIVRQLKGIGRGEDFRVVETYEADTALLKELRGIQEQFAKELGQSVEKHEVEINNFMTREQMDAEISQLLEKRGVDA